MLGRLGSFHQLQQRLAAKPAQPALPVAPKQADPGRDTLTALSPAALTRFGKVDKQKFFAALRPAAEEAERKYGVPAAITLAQAALESGWGKHAIGGYNLFGVKGKGPAGTLKVVTHEKNRTQKIKAGFALYHNFSEAVVEHGKLFHNGYYTKAMKQYAKDRDPRAFARNIASIYTQDGAPYARDLIAIINKYGLDKR